MKVTKKPVEVQAWKIDVLIDSATNNWMALPKEIRDFYAKGGLVFTPTFISISTKEGIMRGNLDDWLIMGVNGEFYPCKDDIFKKTYDYPTLSDTSS